MTKQECKNLPPETPVQRNDGCDGRILACGITETVILFLVIILNRAFQKLNGLLLNGTIIK